MQGTSNGGASEKDELTKSSVQLFANHMEMGRIIIDTVKQTIKYRHLKTDSCATMVVCDGPSTY